MSRASLALLLSLVPSVAAAVDPPDVIEKLRTGQRSTADAAVVVGIETYPFLPHVPFASRDADAFYNFLVYTRGVSPTKLSLLTDNPTATDIREALKLRAGEVGEGGTLWLYFAGHGAADPETGKRLLLGVDVQPKVSSLGSLQTLGVDELDAIASGSNAAQIVAVIDACYTGTGRDGKVLLEGKRFAVPTWTQAPPPKVVTWTAAGPSETSGPFDAAQHGLFTYFVVGALRGWADGEFDGRRDGTVSLAEAQQYVYDAVRTVGGGEQSPGLEAVEGQMDSAMIRGSALETAPDLAELVHTDRAPDAPKPSPTSVVVTGGGSDFAAKLAELKRLRLEREEAELRENALAASVAAERARQVGAATATLLTEAQGAWAQTVELLDAGGDEAILAAELFVETYGSATVVVDDASEPVKVPEVETARSWLLQHGSESPAPVQRRPEPVAEQVVGPNPLDALGSLEGLALWQLPWSSEKLAKKLGGKIRRDSWDDEIWGDAGDQAVGRGDTDLATYFYLHAVAIDATDSEWNSKLSSLGVEAAGLMAVADRVRMDASNDETWGDFGDVLVSAERQAEACTAFQRALELDPADEEWTRKVAEMGCGGVSGVRGDALAEAEAAARAEPSNDERVGDYGDALMNVGQTDQACEAYQRALDLDPADSEWPGKLIGCLETHLVVGSGEAPAAAVDADDVVRRIEREAGDDAGVRAALGALGTDSSEDEHWGDLGDALVAGHRDLALLAYERAMLLDAVDREWQTRITELSDYDRLFGLFQQVLQADPSNDEILGDFGDRLSEAGRRDDACQAYRSAARFDPSDSEWPQHVALCDGSGAPAATAEVAGLVDDDGLGVLADQVRADSGNDERWGDYADGLAERSRTREACEAYARANELDPVDNEWINAIDRLSCSGSLASAPAEAEERDDEVMGDRGDELMNQGDYGSACEAYREALETDPEDTEWPGKLLGCLLRYDATGDEAVGDLGDRLASWGRMTDACAAYREALRIDRDDQEWKDRRADCRGVE